MSFPASVAIFGNRVEYEQVSIPMVPEEVFLAARRVVGSKGMELIRTRGGVFLVQYSETGPLVDKDDQNFDWVPVRIIRLERWSSGGITLEEMQNFSQHEGENLAEVQS